MAKTAAARFQGVTRRIVDVVDSNPVLVALAVLLLVLLVWWSRPGTR